MKPSDKIFFSLMALMFILAYVDYWLKHKKIQKAKGDWEDLKKEIEEKTR